MNIDSKQEEELKLKVKELALKFALQNAVLHDGKADDKSVMSKVIGEDIEVRNGIKGNPNLINCVREHTRVAVVSVNSMTLEEQITELQEKSPEMLVKHTKERGSALGELKNVSGPVVMRFAPGPSGPLHIGHSRAAILNDEYTKKYDGKLILRIEDTDPDRISLDAYDMIPEDLDWLGVKCHETVIQSTRFEKYYEYAKKLIEMGHAYVCKCKPDDWRNLKIKKKPCPHRNLPPETHLEEWDKMLNREYNDEEASVVVKTDLEHPNPAIRDFVALRIVTSIEHPRTGDKYCVYPLMNFSVSIDDRLLGLTHVLRGKDHLNNTQRQEYIFNYFGWKRPEYIHYGRVSIEDVALSKSEIDKGIKGGEFTGWDDVKLGTLRALKKRGIPPEAIRRYWVEMGAKEIDVQFSWETLFAHSKDIIDKDANRYFFVWQPKEYIIKGINKLEGHAPLHPDKPELGVRKIVLSGKGGVKILITNDDFVKLSSGDKIRLKDLGNVKITDKNTCEYVGNDLSFLKEGAKIIHWVGEDNIPIKVQTPDGEIKEGVCEKGVENEIDKVVQFERFGFVRIDRENGKLVGYFAHR